MELNPIWLCLGEIQTQIVFRARRSAEGRRLVGDPAMRKRQPEAGEGQAGSREKACKHFNLGFHFPPLKAGDTEHVYLGRSGCRALSPQPQEGTRL